MNAVTAPPRTLALLVCLFAAGAARGQAVPAAAGDTPAVPAAAASGLGLKWRVPPISTSGTLAYDMRMNRADAEGRSVSHLVTANINARTYFYQPWFATVTGSLAATVGRSRSGVTGVFEDALAGPQASGERFLTGKGRVDLFPRSRFPFEVHVDRADSRVDGAVASSNDFRSANFGFSQRYRPEAGAWAVSAGYDRRVQWGARFRDTHDAVNGDYGTRWQGNDLTLGAVWNASRRTQTDERSDFRTLVARHNHASSKDWSLNTTVNWTQTRDDLQTVASDVAMMQWSSVGLWRREQSPLTFSAAVRGMALRDRMSGGPGLDSLGLTLGAGYEATKNLRLSGNGSVVVTDSAGGGAKSFAGSLGGSWQGETIEFSKYRYDWYASGTAGGATSRHSDDPQGGAADSGGQTLSTLNAQVGHTLSRNFAIAPSSALAVNLAQNLSATANRTGDREEDDPVSRVLLQSVGATLSVSAEDRRAFARLMYSDSRELGAGVARFQLWNFQLSGNLEIGSNRALTGEFTWQRAQQRASMPAAGQPAGLQGSLTRNTGGEITYSHQRLFGIPRLRFTSRLKLAQDVLDQPGMLTSIPDRETRVWENGLDWLVGRLQSRITLRVSEVEGKRREFLMWRVQRNFGD